MDNFSFPSLSLASTPYHFLSLSLLPSFSLFPPSYHSLFLQAKARFPSSSAVIPTLALASRVLSLTHSFLLFQLSQLSASLNTQCCYTLSLSIFLLSLVFFLYLSPFFFLSPFPHFPYSRLPRLSFFPFLLSRHSPLHRLLFARLVSLCLSLYP